MARHPGTRTPAIRLPSLVRIRAVEKAHEMAFKEKRETESENRVRGAHQLIPTRESVVQILGDKRLRDGEDRRREFNGRNRMNISFNRIL